LTVDLDTIFVSLNDGNALALDLIFTTVAASSPNAATIDLAANFVLTYPNASNDLPIIPLDCDTIPFDTACRTEFRTNNRHDRLHS